MVENFQDKLKALGVVKGINLDSKPLKKSTKPIQEILDGEIIRSPYGETFVAHSAFAAGFTQGAVSLVDEIDFGIIAEWAELPRLSKSTMRDIVFLDTETTGLSGGSGTLAFMVGIGYWIEDRFQVTQFFLRDPSEEAVMLENLTKFVASFPIIATFNGKSFDIPLLNTRHILNRIPSPFADKSHLDLLHLARRIWKNRLPNRSLAHLETEILGLKRSKEEVPGWMIPEMYLTYLKTGDAIPMKGIFYHNNMDIVSLAALLIHLSDLLCRPFSFSEPQSLDIFAIAQLYEKFNRLDEALLLYEYSQEIGLPDHFQKTTLYQFANIYRKTDQWEKAVQVWERAAQNNDIQAYIELAKFYEHQRKDNHLALLKTNSALEVLNQTGCRSYDQKRCFSELLHRKERLIQKIEKVRD